MSFLQVTIWNVASDIVDELSELLLFHDAISIDIEDAHLGTALEQELFDEPEDKKGSVNDYDKQQQIWKLNKLIVLFYNNGAIDDMRQLINECCIDCHLNNVDYHIDIIDDIDWIKNSQDQFLPIKITDNLYIVPSWHKSPDINALNITLDPGLAFGTGSHPTTFMCLKWLMGNIKERNITLLDYGCGSGILAICAKKLQIKNVYGVDIDENAIITSKNNAKQNNVDINLCLAHELGQDFIADIVIANILTNPLKLLMTTFKQITKYRLILSGILTGIQSEELIAIYEQYFIVKIIDKIDDWILLECVVKNV